MDEQVPQTPQAPPSQPVPSAPQPTEGQEMTGVERNRLSAALAYLGVLVLVPLLFLDKDDPFVKFHARQGLVLFIAEVIVMIAIGWIPFIGNLVMLLLALVSIVGLIQAIQGKRWKIP